MGEARLPFGLAVAPEGNGTAARLALRVKAWHPSGMEVQLDHVAVYVSDLERSKAFYAEVLGLEDAYPGQWGGAPTIMMAPGSRTGVAIFPAEIGDDGRTNRGPGAIDHVAFRTGRGEQDGLRVRLDALGIAYEVKEFGICHSVFVRDPDGVVVEVTTYDDR